MFHVFAFFTVPKDVVKTATFSCFEIIFINVDLEETYTCSNDVIWLRHDVTPHNMTSHHCEHCNCLHGFERHKT